MDRNVAKHNMKQGASKVQDIKDSLEQKRCEVRTLDEQSTIAKQKLEKMEVITTNKKQQFEELKESMEAAEKLLKESKRVTDEHKAKGDVRAVGLEDRKEMVKLLDEVVARSQREKEELHRKISMFEGQLQ